MADGHPLTRVRDAVWRPTPASLRLLALLGVLCNAGIIGSGGAVRVTGSGLGCPTWPRCTGDSLVPTHHPEHPAVNMAIEFGNRMLTFLVLATALMVFIAAIRLRPRRRVLVALATAQPIGVLAQALIGGVLVHADLHPTLVSLHFLASPTLLIFCVALWMRAGEGDAAPRRLTGPFLRGLSLVLVAATAVVLFAGTVVTGTGPHAGDAQTRRYGFSIEDVTQVHSLLAWVTVALTVLALAAAYRSGAPAVFRRRVLALFAVELAQGLLGYVQYFIGVPEALVVLHMLGAAVMWIAALRLYHATRDRGPVPVRSSPRTVPEPQPA